MLHFRVSLVLRAACARFGVFCVGSALALLAGTVPGSAAQVPVVFTVGDGTEGVFADRQVGYRFTPRELASDARFVAAGWAFMVYITDSGELWGCGQNDLGQLGDGSLLHQATPVRIATDVVTAACGANHLLFVKTDGTLWSVGANASGQLGDGTTQNRAVPVQVATGVARVSAGTAHTLVVKTDGSLWGCGKSDQGQLGLDSDVVQSSLIHIADGVTSASAGGSFSMWVATDGSLWATGANSFGQLGDGTVAAKTTPVKIMDTGVSGIAAGSGHSLVIKSDGTLWTAGGNHAGQLGDGTLGTNRTTHGYITSGTAAATGGFLSSLVVGTDGVLRVMGYNYYGNLGIPRSAGIPLSPYAAFSDVAMAAAGGEFSCFLTTDGTVWATGRNDLGQLGDGFASFRVSPTPIPGGTSAASAKFSSGLYAHLGSHLSWTPREGAFALAAAQVAGGGSYDLVINETGQLLAVDRSAPGFSPEFAQFSPVVDGTEVVDASSGVNHAMFVRADGSLWAVGRNEYGQLGDGSTTARPLPVKVSENVARVSVWSHSVFITSDGTLWGTGYNAHGQLGTGSTTNVVTPVQMATGVTGAAAGGTFTLFVKGDGTLWGVGRNDVGQLGDGTTNDAPVPVLITTGVARAWAGATHSVILKNDGSLWATGGNLYGQLGDGTVTKRLAPVKIADGVEWAEAGAGRTLYMRYVATPDVVVSPATPTTVPGGQVTLEATASGEGTLQFRWYRGTSGDASQPIEDATAATYTTPELAASASFWVRVSNFAGSSDSETVHVTVAGPAITAQPADQAPTAGDDLTLSVDATSVGGAALSYQWFHDDTLIEGATGASLTIRSVQAFHSGAYSVAVSASGQTVRSSAATVAVAPAPASNGRLLNLSTRALDLADENQLIPGFVLAGSGTKRVLIRGVGPSLARFGVSGSLVDPRITVKRGTETVAENDDWGTNANKAELIAVSKAFGAFSLTEGSRDAALLLELPAGQYTVPTPGVDGATGVALVEIYDTDEGASTVNLINMSNRGYVGTGDAIMIPGVVISSHGPRTLLVRAVGPGLARFNVADVLENPRLTIYRRVAGNPPVDEIIHVNDDWQDGPDSANTASVARQVNAFSLAAGSRDAALVVTLKPGLYTVQATGVDDATGVALVEVYLVP